MAELNTVAADGIDREAYSRTRESLSPLNVLEQKFGRLLPHASALLQDLFLAFFKLEPQLIPAKLLPASVMINRQILAMLYESDEFRALRERTRLDQHQAVTATLRVGAQVHELLREVFRGRPQDLGDAMLAAKEELDLERLQDTPVPQARDMEADERGPDDGERDHEIAEALARLESHRRRQQGAARYFTKHVDTLDTELQRASRESESSEQAAQAYSAGGGANVDAQTRIELGERILQSNRLRKLAKILGAMKELASEQRRRRIARMPEELHSLSLGAELERLLPVELVGLRCANVPSRLRSLYRDFLRRFAERQLNQYRIDAPPARGPMVVCLDGSGSMQGSKELWAKAVALTLMDITRRERRAFLGIIFSAGGPLFEVRLEGQTSRRSASYELDQKLRFAEHFPAGGTDFEQPLARAAQAVTEGDCRHGDILFISDGQAPVSEDLVDRLRALKRRHRFKIRVLDVDADQHARHEMARFADSVTAVKDLAGDSLGELFGSL